MALETRVEVHSHIPVEIRNHALEVLAEAHKARQQLGTNRPFVAVLFADLCDSTSYKIDRGDVDGLMKTYMHNSIVGDAVQRNAGIIIKYIGDEVMATFCDADAIANAVTAAIEIQRDIAIYNAQNSDGSKEENIASKIGIHAGNVIMVRFPGHDAEDPQGKVVDATARILSFSGPAQILCSRAIRDKLASNYQFSKSYVREAKGIRDGLEIFEVLYDDKEHQEPKKLRHGDSKTIEVQKLLYMAARDELTDHVQAASNWYDQILRLDPMHFAANHRKARLEFRHRERLSVDFSKLNELTKKAEESHPESGLAKTLSAIIEWSEQHQILVKKGNGVPQFEPAQIEMWAEKVRSAVPLARGECDVYGELISMNALAYFLSLHFENTGSMEIFDEAKTICAMAENLIKDFQGNLVAAFNETYARVLSFDVTSRESLDKAKRLAKQSLALREQLGLPETEHVYETLQRLARQGMR